MTTRPEPGGLDETNPADAADYQRLAVQLVEHSPNGVLVTDAEGRVRMLNPAVRAMLPVVPRSVGRLPIEAIPIPSLAEALDPSRTDDVELVMTAGNRYLLIRVQPLGGTGGRLAILQDVSRLRAVDRQRRDFVANVSHELRTPATAIAGYAETLLEDRETLDPYVVDMVETIHRNALRLSALFNDLLHLSRLDAREDPLPMEQQALRPIVSETLDKVAVLAERKNVTFQNAVPKDIEARFNREAMGHVVHNLVTNAIKYSYEDGLVTVQARWRQGVVALEVIDVGIGIDPGHHERVFERFYRTDKGRSRDAGGTGLGLAIVKKLCDAMGATIQVRSRPGSGSVFRVGLPPPTDVEPPPQGG